MSNLNLSVTSVSLIVGVVLKSAAINIDWILVTSAFPRLIVFAVARASVAITVVAPVFEVFVFALTTDAEIVAITFTLCPLYPLPKLIAKVLPVGDPPRVKSPLVERSITSPTAPVPPDPVVIIETE